MELWLDVHLSRQISKWVPQRFGIPCRHLSDLGFRTGEDDFVFAEARKALGAVVLLSKDEDFPKLVRSFGPPPAIIWLTCGNTSNSVLRRLLELSLQEALNAVRSGEPLVEIDLPRDWLPR